MSKYRFDQIAVNSTAKKKPVEEDKYTYIGLEHLDSGNLNVTRWGSEVAPIGEKLLMKKGDVLFGKRRAYQKKVAIAPFDGIFSAHGMVLRPKEDVIDKDFFPMFISSDYFLDAAIAISVGSLSPTINWKDLAKLEFELPALEDQKKLAAVLWSINDTQQAYQNLLKRTDELTTSQFIEMFGDTVSDTQKYDTVPLIDIFESPQGGEWGSDDPEGTGTPVLRTTNFTDEGIVDYSDVATRKIDEKKLQKKGLIKGDILIEKSGGSNDKPVGRVVYFNGESGKYLNNNFTARLHLKEQYALENLYVFFFMFVNYWAGGTKLYEGKTTGIHNLHLTEYLQETKIPSAPREVQCDFVRLALQCYESKTALQNAMVAAREMKRSILEDALGKE